MGPNSACYADYCQQSAFIALRETQKMTKLNGMKIGEVVKSLRKARRMTLEQMVDKVGSDTGNLSRFENGRQGISDELLARIAKALGTKVSEIHAAAEDRAVYNADPAGKLRTFRDVPVVGTAQLGDNGFWEELEFPVGHGDGYITYPAKDPQTYALRVRGDSMRPRIKSGEFIVAEPHTPPQPGDDVVVKTKSGRSMVKELLYMRDNEVALGSINQDHKTITIPLTDIESIHYVAAIIPRGAFYKSGE